jgi:hypothetical protein
MSKDEKHVQMKLVELPESHIPTIREAAKKRRSQMVRRPSVEEIYESAVQDAVTRLDNKVLNQLESTQKEMQALAKTVSTQSQKNDELLEQNRRYQNTLEKLLPSLSEQVINKKNPQFVVSQSEWGQADVTTVSIKGPAEAIYPYTAGILGQFVGISPSRMGIILRKFDIFDDPTYHHTFSTGGRSQCQKYKLSSLKEIFIRRTNPKYSQILTENEISQIHNFLKMKASENAL